MSANAEHFMSNDAIAAMRQLQTSANTATAATATVAPKLIPTPSVMSVSAAASVEAFYRSLMNAQINAALTGVKGPLFPQMHVQLPTRVVYINGFKGVRRLIDDKFQPASEPTFSPLRLGCAIAPGVIMTPVSSILEACNANLNPEPLHIRWLRGIVARCGREVIFGLGLNQLSEHFEEQVPAGYSPALRNALGSMMGGVVAGYLSHVPHNLSTMKLMNPAKSYLELFKMFSARKLDSVSFIPASRPQLRNTAAMVLSLVAPAGLAIRTTQVVGSFIILNGIINGMSGVTWARGQSEDDR
eukprot:TRINITY_DN11985_c2_g2_i3.p1 TRINITY_DN11985_c2_g2~~TRINITY_DN11985_c2_g2_i3.p1  ORF type:complete len:300 (+),score=55.80 TRINITY_DN11985_c2_g2_i3:330-1229(+)